MYFLLINSTIL